MRTLDKILEGLLDVNFDIADADALEPIICREVFMETASNLKIHDGEVWVTKVRDGQYLGIDTDHLKKFGIKKIYSNCGDAHIISSSMVENFDLIFDNGGDCCFETYGNQTLFKNVSISNCVHVKFTSVSGMSTQHAYKFENVIIDADFVKFGRIDKLTINAKSRFKSTSNIDFEWISRSFAKMVMKCVEDPDEIQKAIKLSPKSFPSLRSIIFNDEDMYFKYHKISDHWYCDTY